jgi:hypothetical protein
MENAQLLGFIGLSTLSIKFIDNDLLFGSILLSSASILLSYQFYKKINKKKQDKLSKGHTLMVLYNLLNFTFKISKNQRPTDLIALFGHALLITKNKYNKYGNMLLAVYYILFIYNNMNGKSAKDKLQMVCGGLILSNYLNTIALDSGVNFNLKSMISGSGSNDSNSSGRFKYKFKNKDKLNKLFILILITIMLRSSNVYKCMTS